MNPLIKLPVSFSKHLIKNKWLLKNKVTSSKIESIIEQTRKLFPKYLPKKYGEKYKGWGSGFMDAVKKQDVLDDLGGLGLKARPKGGPLGLLEVKRTDLKADRLLAMARDAVKYRTKKLKLSNTTNKKKRLALHSDMKKLSQKEWNPKLPREGKTRTVPASYATMDSPSGDLGMTYKRIKTPKRLKSKNKMYKDEEWYTQKKIGVPRLKTPIAEKLHETARLARPMTNKDLQRVFGDVKARHGFENWRRHYKIKRPTERHLENYLDDYQASTVEPYDPLSETFFKIINSRPMNWKDELGYLGIKPPIPGIGR